MYSLAPAWGLGGRDTVSQVGAIFYWKWMKVDSRIKFLTTPLMGISVSSLYLWHGCCPAHGRSLQGQSWFYNLLLDKGRNGSRSVILSNVIHAWSQEAFIPHLTHVYSELETFAWWQSWSNFHPIPWGKSWVLLLHISQIRETEAK